jgi:hypothetical protein
MEVGKMNETEGRDETETRHRIKQIRRKQNAADEQERMKQKENERERIKQNRFKD